MGDTDIKLQLDTHIDTQLIIITQYLIENPGLNEVKEYRLDKIVGLPIEFTLNSQSLFAVMSSAFSLDKNKREQFIGDHPATAEYLSTLGPNRRQYAMILFDQLHKLDSLITGIVQNYFVSITDRNTIMDYYERHSEFRIRKGIFIASPPKVRAQILLFDTDPRMRKLNYEIQE